MGMCMQYNLLTFDHTLCECVSWVVSRAHVVLSWISGVCERALRKTRTAQHTCVVLCCLQAGNMINGMEHVSKVSGGLHTL
jgi:hypothetical protein